MNIVSQIINLILGTFLITNISVTSLNISEVAVNNTVSSTNINLPIFNNKSNGTKVVDNTKKSENQEVHTQNSIKKIWVEDNGLLYVTAELISDKQELKISIYNMLGKEVRVVYQGLAKDKNDDGYYIFTSQNPINLPKNVYILVIQGETFKIADRFIIAK